MEDIKNPSLEENKLEEKEEASKEKKVKKKFNIRLYTYICYFIDILVLVLAFGFRTRIEVNGEYDNINQITLYLQTFDGVLPNNYISPTRAKNLYSTASAEYPKLSPEDAALVKAISEGYMIGGEVHAYNRANEFKEDGSKISKYVEAKTDLRECDIYLVDTATIIEDAKNGVFSRSNAKLVYFANGDEVWYTTDNCQTFTLINTWDINPISNILYLSCCGLIVLEFLLVFILIIAKKVKPSKFKKELKRCSYNTMRGPSNFILVLGVGVYVFFLNIFKHRKN